MDYADQIWPKILMLMEGDGEGKLSPTTINAWFDDTQAVSMEENTFVLYTPTPFKRDLIVSRYLTNIQTALRELFSSPFQVKVLCGGEWDPKKGTASSSFLPGTEKYTFDKFIVGSSNKFAYAAAQAVSKKPGIRGYNPLFIYGSSGLGKTHLLYAIAHAAHDILPNYQIIYIKGEKFSNDLIDAIQAHRNQEFRDKYRFVDIFLMDDVQFLAGKDFGQEELFHTFNSLYEAGKQIVFTSDRPPEEMQRLDERLKTRFTWGLPVDVQPPDYETRVAIIKNKAIRQGMHLPDPVLRYIADNITSNVRQIEGTLNKLLAFHELMGEDVNVDTVTRAVRDMFKEKSDFFPSVDEIIEEVGKFYDIDASELKGKSQNKDIVLPRQIAMYEIRRITNLSLHDIGVEFQRHHSTVLHSIERVEQLIKKSPEMKEIIKDINANINARYE